MTDEKRKLDQTSKKLEVLEVKNGNVNIENGHELIRNLKKEAKRQKALKVAEDLETATLPVECLPTVESRREEIELAETFEIIEE